MATIQSAGDQHPTRRLIAALMLSTQMMGCSLADIPEPRPIDIPQSEVPGDKFSKSAVNRLKDAPVVYVKLGKDVLRPVLKSKANALPDRRVGPFELREETLAAALQLVMAGADIPLAFQTSEALARTVTVSQLQGSMDDVVDRLCGLADLYCSYEKGVLVIKDVETFSVSLPPISGDNYDQFLNGIRTVTGRDAYIDGTTRTLIYSTSHRNAEQAEEFFERLRANTALIVFETQIWEVTLNTGNNTGIRWQSLSASSGSSSNTVTNGNLGFNGNLPSPAIENAVTGGIRYLSGDMNVNVVFEFLLTQGAVKTISQPQITVLSGSTAKLRVGNSQKYVSQVTRSQALGGSGGDNFSLTTDTLDTGLDMEINSAWDQATVYGNLKLDLQDLVFMDSITVGGDAGTKIQLPETSERSLETRIRVRPGDSLIIGGIVQERNTKDRQGFGATKPTIPTYKKDTARNSELVIMMRPRVVVYTDAPPSDAVLLNNDMYLEHPKDDLPAINMMSKDTSNTTPAVQAPPANPVPTPDEIAPPPQNTRRVSLPDTDITQPVPTAPPVSRPKPLSAAEVQRLKQQSGGSKPAAVTPPAPSMSQYLNDLAPMQIAPDN